MVTAFIGTKKKQSQAFTEDGKRIPVTFIEVGPCRIVRVSDHDAFKNVQIAAGTAKHVSKAIEGAMKKIGADIKPRFLREIRVAKDDESKAGDTVTVDQIFQPGDEIMITGTSKGKGFMGVVRRHGFAGMPKTHGTSDRERAPGSIGSTTTPGRVFKGKRMAGRTGSDTVTVKGLKVVSVDAAQGVLIVKGLVPGGKNGLLLIQKSVK